MNWDNFSKNTLSNEQKLLLITTRLTFDEFTKAELRATVSQNINWPEFIKYACYHRVLTLAWFNIQRYVPSCNMPRYIRDMLLCTYNSLKKRNRILLTELSAVQEKLREENIVCVPVKGAFLLNNLYKDIGVRYTGDYDFLIYKKDKEKVRAAMNSIGYYEGFYDYKSQARVSPSREDTIRWTLWGGHMLPFIKPLTADNINYCKFDFRFAFASPLNEDAVMAMINTYAQTGNIDPVYIYIHLCVHFYTEAHFDIAKALGKDINMIKLCDIREFYLQNIRDDDIPIIIDFIYRYAMIEPIVFTLCTLNIVYSDGYEDILLSRLADKQLLNEAGKELYLSNTQEELYNTMFWENFFSGDNS